MAMGGPIILGKVKNGYLKTSWDLVVTEGKALSLFNFRCWLSIGIKNCDFFLDVRQDTSEVLIWGREEGGPIESGMWMWIWAKDGGWEGASFQSKVGVGPQAETMMGPGKALMVF